MVQEQVRINAIYRRLLWQPLENICVDRSCFPMHRRKLFDGLWSDGCVAVDENDFARRNSSQHFCSEGPVAATNLDNRRVVVGPKCSIQFVTNDAPVAEPKIEPLQVAARG